MLKEQMLEPSQSLVQRLDTRVTAFFAGLVLLVTLDTILVETRDAASMAWRYWLSSVAASFWIALLLGATTALLSFLFARPFALMRSRLGSATALVSGAAWGFLAGLITLVLLQVWNLATDPYSLTLSIPLAFTAAGVVIQYLACKLPRLAWTLLCAALCVLCFAIDAWVFRRLYLGLHNTLAFVAIVASGLGSMRYRMRVRAFPLLALLACLSQLTLFSDLREVRASGVAEGVLQPKIFRLLHALSDRDRDGYSAILGGGDCDDGDAERAPDRCEVPGNGIDDNCNGIVDGAGLTPAATTNTDAEIRQPHIYIILADAMRFDYGRVARSDIAPAIDAFAAKSLDFKLAYTPYPSTYRALISTLKGRYWSYASDAHPNLFRVLASRGYDAQLWIADARLTEQRTGPSIVDTRARGGDPFKLPPGSDKKVWTAQIVDEAIAEISIDKGPRMRWLHFLDTHSPCLRGDQADSELDCYREEVRHTSREFGRLWQALRDSEANGRGAVVIFIADHGEEFGDHQGNFHGSTLFEENTHVPMIVHLPGVSPRIIAEPASLLDIAPTLLTYLGVPAPPGYQGVNHLAGEPPPTARVLSEVESLDNLGGLGLPALRMARDERYKLVLNLTDNLVSLYDLVADPTEQRDVYVNERNKATPLLKHIAQWQEGSDCRER